MIKGKTFVICLPGKTYSGKFVTSMIELVMYIQGRGGKVMISQHYSPMVNFARCKVAGANVMSGINQKPFGGADYDYMLWIDSDQVFDNTSFQKLLDMDKEIASGWYCQPYTMTDGSRMTPIVEFMNNAFFLEHGSYQFLSANQIQEKEEPFVVDYIGFGWVLIKNGVFERMDYPWFAPKPIKLSDDITEMCSEDVAFCRDAMLAGFDIWVDPTCKVGHEKLFVV
jgi:hypothetical protein